jgi:enoyl-[acyl-carrier protein] reductase II
MNRICALFNIKYPVVQGGMVWCSGWRLASAVSNCGGLGLIGAGSMYPETLDHHIKKAREATDKPFGVNVPLLYPDIDRVMEVIWQNKVPIVFTSAGSPKKWTPWLKEKGIKVVHVISSASFAEKSEAAGVNAVVAEGFEAGGHNGREETTTLALIPAVRAATSLPLLAAGGIASGKAMLAAMVLGAEGVQIGSRFAVSDESSAHPEFKKLITQTGEGGTRLVLKKLAPVRLVKNAFYNLVDEAENRGASIDELKEILGRGRAKRGIFEGDLNDGELEIGQVSALINDVLSVEVIMSNLISEYRMALNDIAEDNKYKL